jgi:amidase
MKFILSCAGPLSSDLDAIETFFQSVFSTQPARLDSTILDIPWREVPVKSTLRIGVVPESSIFPLHPPVRRVLAEAVRLLEAQGHQIIHLAEADCRILESNEIGWTLFGLDQGSKKHLEAAGEPPVPAMHYLMKQAGGLMSFYKPTLPDTSTFDPLQKLALLNTRRAELRENYRKLWLQHDLDIFIAPPAQTTAVEHDTFGVAPYTTLTNVLDVRDPIFDSVPYVLMETLVSIMHPSLWRSGWS